MSTHNIYKELKAGWFGVTGNIFPLPNSGGYMFAWGATVPSDEATGYAPGCIFLDIDASGESVLFVNVGSVTSADFDSYEIGLETTLATAAGAAKIGLASTGYAATDVEAALVELLSAANGKGASLIGLEDADANLVAADVEAGIAEIFSLLVSVSNAEGAALVGIEDSGTFTTAATVEAATAEIYQHIATAQAIINLPLGSWTEGDGTALAIFADGDTETPGYKTGDEGFGIRWNNKGTLGPITTSVPIPPDLDDSADVIVHFLAAKTGETDNAGNTPTWLVLAYNAVADALWDADDDFGGTSSAMLPAATARTLQEETLTLAAANIAAAPCVMTLIIQPTDGTLDTDDLVLVGIWLEYTRKILTA